MCPCSLRVTHAVLAHAFRIDGIKVGPLTRSEDVADASLVALEFAYSATQAVRSDALYRGEMVCFNVGR